MKKYRITRIAALGLTAFAFTCLTAGCATTQKTEAPAAEEEVQEISLKQPDTVIYLEEKENSFTLSNVNSGEVRLSEDSEGNYFKVFSGITNTIGLQKAFSSTHTESIPETIYVERTDTSFTYKKSGASRTTTTTTTLTQSTVDLPLLERSKSYILLITGSSYELKEKDSGKILIEGSL